MKLDFLPLRAAQVQMHVAQTSAALTKDVGPRTLLANAWKMFPVKAILVLEKPVTLTFNAQAFAVQEQQEPALLTTQVKETSVQKQQVSNA
jgi:hypothetical protein